ncbi:HNH endonuclease signature motif containing protein [Nocardia sp. NPDC050193]
MPSTNAHDLEWFSHTGHRTFELADRLYGMALGGLSTVARIRDAEQENEFLATWSRDTFVHRLARMAAHDMFYDESDSEPSMWDLHSATTPGEFRTVRYMSVTVALLHYRLEHVRDSFEVPSAPNAREISSDHFVNDIMLGAPYEQLLHRMADEVFHAIFPYRTLLYNLNWIAATFISELDAEMCSMDPEVAKLFARPGRLKRRTIPKWVQRAVFFRDQGHCTYCKRDLTGLMHAMSVENYDHMVPLAEGGLNDVTNLQLLCSECNSKKSADIIEPGDQYIRWFRSVDR